MLSTAAAGINMSSLRQPSAKMPDFEKIRGKQTSSMPRFSSPLPLHPLLLSTIG